LCDSASLASRISQGHGISQATYFNWRLKQLEDENAKLRKVVADLSRDKEIRRKL